MTGRRATLRLTALVAVVAAAAATPALAAPATKSGGSTTATLTAPYTSQSTAYPPSYGLSADRTDGSIRAPLFPDPTTAGPRTIIEDTAFVGSMSPLKTAHTVTVNFHITSATATLVNYPEFEEYLLVGLSGILTDGVSYFGPNYYCNSTPVFGPTDSPGGAGAVASVSDRDVSISCNLPYGYGGPVWGGVYMRTSSAAPRSLDAKVTSITVSS